MKKSNKMFGIFLQAAYSLHIQVAYGLFVL